MSTYQPLFLAISGSLLVLGGAVHVRQRHASAAVLVEQAGSGLVLARIVAGHAGALGIVMAIVGGLGIVGAVAPAVPVALAAGPALVAGVLLLVHGTQVLRHGDLPCGCLGVDDEPMTMAALLPSGSVVLGGLLALAASVGDGGSASGAQVACLVPLGVQAAVVVSLLGLALGHSSESSTRSVDQEDGSWLSS